MPLRRKIGSVQRKIVQSVLGRYEGQRTPNHVALDEARYKDQRIFPPGMWCGWHTTSEKFVFLPRATAAGVAGTTITLNPYMAGIFFPAQSLRIINADGTFSATTVTVVSVNVKTDQIVLSATVPQGSNIGDPLVIPRTKEGNKLGVISPNLPINLDENYYFGVHAGGTFYKGLMPYLDKSLEDFYPLIMYV